MSGEKSSLTKEERLKRYLVIVEAHGFEAVVEGDVVELRWKKSGTYVARISLTAVLGKEGSYT